MLRNPPDILLTTPRAWRRCWSPLGSTKPPSFSRIRFVVADELHAFGADDRGWHLLHILDRISTISGMDAQRIGLSATVGEPDRVAEAGSAEIGASIPGNCHLPPQVRLMPKF